MTINCGGPDIQAIVASSCNLGAMNCGIDMIAPTWNVATGGAPPGIGSCSVRLSTVRPMGGTTARCAIRPDSIAGEIAT